MLYNKKKFNGIFTVLYICISELCYIWNIFPLCSILVVYDCTHQNCISRESMVRFIRNLFYSICIQISGILTFRLFSHYMSVWLLYYRQVHLQASMHTSSHRILVVPKKKCISQESMVWFTHNFFYSIYIHISGVTSKQSQGFNSL